MGELTTNQLKLKEESQPLYLTDATLRCVAAAQMKRDKAMAPRQALVIQNRTAR